MYRRRPNPFARLLTVILLGVGAGLVFLAYDSLRQPHRTPPRATPTPALTVVPPDVPLTLEATMIPAPLAGASLFLPSAGVYAPVIEVYLDGVSWDVSQLGMNVGHLQGTAWMDDVPGNIVLSAHVEMSDGRAGIFARLHELKPGDLVILRQYDDERRYTVTTVRKVAPDDLTPLYPTTTEQITLITCGNYNFFQDTYLERIIVVAERVG